MRTGIELRRLLGSVPIEDIRLNAKSWDDTPALPVGIQAVYKDEALRNELFALLSSAPIFLQFRSGMPSNCISRSSKFGRDRGGIGSLGVRAGFASSGLRRVRFVRFR